MTPHVALVTPEEIGLPGVADDDHLLHPRRRRDERAGDGRADAGDLGHAQLSTRAEVGQCATYATHHVAPLDRDLSFYGIGGHGQDGRDARFGDAQRRQLRAHCVQRGRHGEIVVERRVGVRFLEGNDLRVAIAAIGGDDDPRRGILDPIGERLVGEAAEHRCEMMPSRFAASV